MSKEIIPGNIIDGKVFVDADKTALLLEAHTVLETPQNDIDTTTPTNATVAKIVHDCLSGG